MRPRGAVFAADRSPVRGPRMQPGAGRPRPITITSLGFIALGFVLGLTTSGLFFLQNAENQIDVSTRHELAGGATMPQLKNQKREYEEKGAARNGDNQPPHDATITDDIVDFDPNPPTPVVIATKIQGDGTFDGLNQTLCLLNYAYNNRVHYDIVAFATTPLSEEYLKILQSAVAPAKITVVVDNPGLQEMVDDLTEDRKQHLLERCNVTSTTELNWRTRCNETTSSGTTVMPIAYNWQAEFRALHIWKHPALVKYKYMMWVDTDAFCTKVWEKDPIAMMRRNNLVILFDHFPAGRANGVEWINKTKAAFGKHICGIGMTNGTLYFNEGKCRSAKFLSQIYGFFHVTDLDFYRSDAVMNWQRIMIGDAKFSRKYDDQIAVTMPAAVLAGDKAWDMRYHGLNMGIAHNFLMDGNKDERVGSFKRFWPKEGPTSFPEAYGKCEIKLGG